MLLNLDLPYSKAAPKEGEKAESNVQTSCVMLSYLLTNLYKDGVNGSGGVRRILGRIQRKLDKVEFSDGELKTIDLETAEVDLCKKALSEVNTPTIWSRWIFVLEDEINSLGMEKEKEAPEDGKAAEPKAE